MDENEVKIAEVAKPETPVKKKKKGLVIALVAVLVAVLVAALAFVLAVKVIIPNSRYNAAIALMDAGQYHEAIAAFEALGEFKDSVALKAECIYDILKAGDIITFGTYEQDNDTANGSEVIEWIVLDKKEDRLLVISKYALVAMRYDEHDRYEWENCELRSWLNGEFYETAFIAREQAAICESVVVPNPVSSYENPGNTTIDKVFILGINQADGYFETEEARMCAPTDYALAQGAYTSEKYTVCGKTATAWWLRSVGEKDGFPLTLIINSHGGAGVTFTILTNVCVRPALWIDYKALLAG